MTSERAIDAGGRTIRYLEAGSGWPVLLIHAFPLRADMWRPQLDRVPDGWRYIAPDLRGFGPGPDEDRPSARTMDDYARDLIALLDALEIERAAIGGLSMGGYVTFALFRLAPERFSAYVLANTRPQADSPEGRRARREMSELVRAKGPAAVADSMLPKLLGETTRRTRPDLDQTVRGLIESNTAAGIDAAIHAMLSRPDSTADLARMSCPALVIASREDAVIPLADSELMERELPRSHLVVLDRAGHLSNLEAPEEFSRALEDFLTSNR